MLQISDNVRQEINKLIPASIVPDIKCFVFYDNYPRSEDRFDICICTENGNLLEYYKREITFSVSLNTEKSPINLRILRNQALYYLVATVDEVIIISRKERKVIKYLNNVDKYSLDDPTCRGKTVLKVVRKDDAVPIVFDDNFNELDDKALIFGESNKDEFPIITQLKQKFTEAQYSVKCNENILKEYSNLRQRAALAVYNRNEGGSKNSIFKIDLKNIPSAVSIINNACFIKVCNKKIVIVKQIVNECDKTISNINILLNSNSSSSLVTKTKLFEKRTSIPFWTERSSTDIPPQCEIALTCIIDMEELKCIDKKIELYGAISYSVDDNEYLMPFEDNLPPFACLGDEFDVLSSQCENNNIFLSILATTAKIDLRIRHIKTNEAESISFANIFTQSLGMEEMQSKMFVYKKSPYHILYGSMIIISDGKFDDHVIEISVYVRSEHQALGLIHLIYDTVPAKLIITPTNYNITAKVPELTHYNEISNDQDNMNYKEYASSLLKRTDLILEYMDNSLIKMTASKDTNVLNQIGTSIDLFANGVDNFIEFKNKLLGEARRGFEVLNAASDDVMVVE